MSEMEVRNSNVTGILSKMPISRFLSLHKYFEVVKDVPSTAKDNLAEVYETTDKQLDALGLKIKAVYKGTGVDDKENNWRFFRWEVDVFFCYHHTISIPFRMGVAHHISKYDRNSGTILSISPIPPSLSEVMHSLVCDFVDKGTKFKDWCSEIGVSDDSIKYLKIFNRCKNKSRTLEKVNFPLAECREILQDF